MLSDGELRAIRERSDRSAELGDVSAGQRVTAEWFHVHRESAKDVPALLAEIERLRV